MYEQIVVDTGSDDRTVELAESMGAKVYHFSWVDDFAAAKNFALEQASGDWIAFLDADEYLTKEWAEKLYDCLKQLDHSTYDAMSSPLFDLDDNGDIASTGEICRFFRHRRDIMYIYPVHEVLTVQKEHIFHHAQGFPVHHTGYTAQAMAEKDKLARNRRLLEKELEKTPDDYVLMGYLGDVCSNEDELEAEYWYRKAIALMPDPQITMDERSATTYIHLLTILANRKEEASFLALYHEASERIPWSCDIDYIAGRFYLGKKEYQKAAFHLEQAMHVAERYGKKTFSIYLYANLSEYWEQLALCSYQIGNLSSCVQYCVGLLKNDNRRIAALTLLLQSLVGEKPETVIQFLGNLYDISASADRMFLVKGAIVAEAEAVLKVLKEFCEPHELKVLEELRV